MSRLTEAYEEIILRKTGRHASVLPPNPGGVWVDLKDSGFIGCLYVTGDVAVWLPFKIENTGTPFKEAA